MKEKFGREPKMMTTEPSDDKLKHEGMKKGGKAMGGAMMPMRGAETPMREQMPMRSAMPRRKAMAMQPALLTRKKGGEVESEAMQHKEDAEIHKVEKELKHHESMGAKKAHHGLKKGGMTGDVEGSGYKHGGKAHHISGHPVGSHEHHKHMAKHHAKLHKEGGSAHHKKMHEHHKAMCSGGKMADGGLAEKGDKFQNKGTLKPKIDVQDKVHEAKQTKSFHTKTHGVEGKGYKKGGTISDATANRYLNDMEDGSKPHKKAGKTGEIHESPAGYKKGGHVKHHADGGHVAHHTTMGHDDCGHTSMHKLSSKHEHGHEKIDGHPMRGGGHVKHHSKMSTHHKKGGKACNY